MNSNDFLNAIGNAKFGILISTKAAVEAVAAIVKEQDLALVDMSVGRDLLLSSPNEVMLKTLVEKTNDIKGVEVVRRLMLQDLSDELSGNYEEAEIVTVTDRSDRQRHVFVGRNGGNVTIRSIVDPGIRKNARVLAIALTELWGRWEVVGYEFQQYETASDRVSPIGEAVRFQVCDYEKPESELDARTPLERCRRAAVEFKITGGAGDDKWVEARAKAILKSGKAVNEAAAADQAECDLAAAGESFSRVLFAITGTAMAAAYERFPLKQPVRQERGHGRHQKARDLGAYFAEATGKTREDLLAHCSN